MPEQPTSSAKAAIREWRTFVLERALLFCFALALLASVLAWIQFGWPAGGLAPIGLAAALLVGSCMWIRGERIQPLRVVAVVAAVLPACWAALYLYGPFGVFAPNLFAGHVLLVVLVALIAGRRAAWGVWGLGGAGWIAIGIAHSLDPPLLVASTDTPASQLQWVRIVAINLAISAAALAAVSYLCERMVQAVHRAESFRGALERQTQDRIQALERERSLTQQLQQAQKLEAIGTLAGGVAHDFNNLLVVIMGNADLVAEEEMSPEVRGALRAIEAAAERAASLTTKLLTLGRQQTIERHAILADEAVDSSIKMLSRVLPESIEIETRLETPEARLWLAASELDQIVVNLCINARDAMPDGGRLLISTKHRVRDIESGGAPRPCIELEIEDTGTGMDSATQERIFEPFFSTKGPRSGTGLGLSTVYGIVRQAGGEIEVTSSPGLGTTISIYLPLFQGEPSASAAAASSVASVQRGTLLVADDDPEVGAIMQRILSRKGYDLIHCSNGVHALEELRRREGHVDLIVCDAVMPQMGGRELHSAILKSWGEIPFLVCSGYAADSFEPEFFSHPTRGFIAKPFGERALLRRVQELLHSSNRTRGSS